jgi:glutathione synthase/RimK-type ligase-like ATP-grasp enzyme
VSTEEETLAVYAWRLERGLTKEDFSAVASSPTFLQEEVPKCSDIRLTVVGEEMFGVRIRRRDCSVLDWRRELGKGLDYERILVSPQVENCVRKLMRELSISYGALDFAERTDGGWSFLEVNPAGQWEWLEPAVGVPITRAISSWLQSR